MKILNKEQVQKRLMMEDKTMSELAAGYGVSVAAISLIAKRTLFKITLCWKGENHTFYRYSKTRAQALSQAIRGTEKALGYVTKSLSAHFKLEYNSIVHVVPCICLTCSKPNNCDCIDSIYSCEKCEEKR